MPGFPGWDLLRADLELPDVDGYDAQVAELRDVRAEELEALTAANPWPPGQGPTSTLIRIRARRRADIAKIEAALASAGEPVDPEDA